MRAGLLQVNLKGGGLPHVAGFPWSSLPHFQERPSLRPAFLVTSQGFGAFDFKDGIRGRRQFVERVAQSAHVEAAEKCGLAEIAGQGLQATLRRGWCYGTEAFKEKMQELSEDLLERRSTGRGKSGNDGGAEIHDHGERRAGLILRAGLEAFDLAASALDPMGKSPDEKALIALQIRRETTMPLAWIAKHLAMGSVSNVTRSSLGVERRLPKERGLRRAMKKIDAKISS